MTRRAALGSALAALPLLSLGGGRTAAASGVVNAWTLQARGLSVARLRLRQAFEGAPGADGRVARSEFKLATKGMARLIGGRNETRYSALTTLGGAGEAPPQPLAFRAEYEKPDRLREIDIAYAPDGTIQTLRLVSNGNLQETEVPDELRLGAVDPLTALLRVQHWVQGGPADGDRLDVPVFDGRKRLDLVVESNSDGLWAHLVGRHGFDPGDSMVTLEGQPPNRLRVEAAPDGGPGGWPTLLSARSDSAALVPEA